jgi:hypothetical protein
MGKAFEIRLGGFRSRVISAFVQDCQSADSAIPTIRASSSLPIEFSPSAELWMIARPVTYESAKESDMTLRLFHAEFASSSSKSSYVPLSRLTSSFTTRTRPTFTPPSCSISLTHSPSTPTFPSKTTLPPAFANEYA